MHALSNEPEAQEEMKCERANSDDICCLTHMSCVIQKHLEIFLVVILKEELAPVRLGVVLVQMCKVTRLFPLMSCFGITLQHVMRFDKYVRNL